MTPRSIFELTPLIDVFLILIFAFMINNQKYTQQKDVDLVKTQQEINGLKNDIAKKDSVLKLYQSSLDSSQMKIWDYQDEMSSQKQLMDKTISELSKKLATFFGEASLDLKEQMRDGALEEEDYENFEEKMYQLDIKNRSHIIEKIYVLGELQAYSSIISVYVGVGNEILIDRKKTNIKLSDFDDKKDDFPAASKKFFSEKLKKALMDNYNLRKKSKDKLGDIVLITFGYSSDALFGVIPIAKKVVNQFYNDIEDKESLRKVIFSDLGFYPL